jgi:hypothetical protein
MPRPVPFLTHDSILVQCLEAPSKQTLNAQTGFLRFKVGVVLMNVKT